MKRRISISIVVSTFLMLIICMSGTAYARDSLDSKQCANALYELGLFKGVGTTTGDAPNFALEQSATRNEAITMLVRLLGKEPEALSGEWNTPFTDVEEWAKPYVGYAYTNGLTSGTSATQFGGRGLITASQYITFILRSLGYKSGTDFEWDKSYLLSDELGITSGEFSKDKSGFSRGDVAIISYSALSARLKDSDDSLISCLAGSNIITKNAAAKQGIDVYNIGSKIHFIYDIRTFTLYSFMNYTGYDDNNGRQIAGVRKSIREDIDSMKLSISNPNYISQKGVHVNRYPQALKCLGDAPDFKLISSLDSTCQGLSDLPKNLSEFYQKANIPVLYEKYRPDYEEALSKYDTCIPDLNKMLGYFNLDSVANQEFGIEVNLLDAFNRGSGSGSKDHFYGYGVIRTGPSTTANTLNVLHEYAHGFTNPVLDEHSSKVNALSKCYIKTQYLTDSGYTSWSSVVDECFVRAISLYFDENYTGIQKRDMLKSEVLSGFVMTDYIYNRIPEFENFNGSFSDFIGILLSEYAQ